MKALFVCLLLVAACSFLACETGLNLNQGRASYLWQGVAFEFDTSLRELEVTNRGVARKYVRILQYNESSNTWENVQGRLNDCFHLRGSTQGGYHGVLFSNVPYDLGLTFSLSVRLEDEEDWSTTIIELIPDGSGVQGETRTRMLVVEVDTSRFLVPPPSSVK